MFMNEIAENHQVIKNRAIRKALLARLLKQIDDGEINLLWNVSENYEYKR